MINRSSLMNISGNRKILTREEDFAYLLPCEQLQILISNFTSLINQQYRMIIPLCLMEALRSCYLVMKPYFIVFYSVH